MNERELGTQQAGGIYEPCALVTRRRSTIHGGRSERPCPEGAISVTIKRVEDPPHTHLTHTHLSPRP